MDNPSFEDDGKKLPGPSSSEIKSDVNNKRTVVSGLFTWREVLEGMVGSEGLFVFAYALREFEPFEAVNI